MEHSTSVSPRRIRRSQSEEQSTTATRRPWPATIRVPSVEPVDDLTEPRLGRRHVPHLWQLRQPRPSAPVGPTIFDAIVP